MEDIHNLSLSDEQLQLIVNYAAQVIVMQDYEENEKPELEMIGTSLDERRHRKYDYTIKYQHPLYRTIITKKTHDSIASIESWLKDEGIDNYEIF